MIIIYIVHELFKYFISPDEFIENSTKKNGACIQHLKFYMFCWIRKLTRMRNKNKYFENIIIFACSQGEHLIPRIIY